VETWQENARGEMVLVGGLYGVSIGGLFAAESKFHRVTDASKVALVALVDMLRTGGGTLLDVQWTTPHLASLGAVDVSRERYAELVADAVARPPVSTFPEPAGR
jgi:leucyl/phenylalanyl-tRNA--protein transferase